MYISCHMQLQHVLSQLCCSHAHFVFEEYILHWGYFYKIRHLWFAAMDTSSHLSSLCKCLFSFRSTSKDSTRTNFANFAPACNCCCICGAHFSPLIVAPFAAAGLSLRESHPVQEFLFGPRRPGALSERLLGYNMHPGQISCGTAVCICTGCRRTWKPGNTPPLNVQVHFQVVLQRIFCICKFRFHAAQVHLGDW